MFYGIKLCRIKSCGAAPGDPIPDVKNPPARGYVHPAMGERDREDQAKQARASTDHSHGPWSLGRLIRSRQGNAEWFHGYTRIRRPVSIGHISAGIVQHDQVYPVLVTALLRMIRGRGGSGQEGPLHTTTSERDGRNMDSVTMQ